MFSRKKRQEKELQQKKHIADLVSMVETARAGAEEKIHSAKSLADPVEKMAALFEATSSIAAAANRIHLIEQDNKQRAQHRANANFAYKAVIAPAAISGLGLSVGIAAQVLVPAILTAGLGAYVQDNYSRKKTAQKNMPLINAVRDAKESLKKELLATRDAMHALATDHAPQLVLHPDAEKWVSILPGLQKAYNDAARKALRRQADRLIDKSGLLPPQKPGA